jgi:hypothetical protein
MGGKCAIAWVNAACPRKYGGLGIPNLQLMGLTLRLHWLWLARVDSDKTWSEYAFRVDRSCKEFFDASVTVQVGDGSRALFWMDRWLRGCSIRQLAPDLWNVVPARSRNSRTVQNALRGNRWVWDITLARIVLVVVQYLHLWDTLRDYYLSDQPDRFIWKWSSSGDFSSSSAYKALFVGEDVYC